MKKHPAAIIAAILVAAAIAAAAAVAGVMIHDLSKGESDSTDTPTWREQYDLGVRYLRSGNYEEAVIAFKAAIEIDPKKADAYIGLADAYIGLGDTEKAEDVLTDALSAVRSSDRADIESKLAELDSTAPVGPGPNDPDSADPPEPAHTHVWLDTTCTEPRTCSECGETEGEPLGHTWQDATCTEPRTCIRCGMIEGEPAGHKWEDATCTTPKRCVNCHTTEGTALGHVWIAASCTDPQTCSVCGATTGTALGHIWSEATCTDPQICSVCGAIKGSPLGHDMLPATKEAPSTCSRCGITEGEPLDYVTWSFADGTLTISGRGKMDDYIYSRGIYHYASERPWSEAGINDQITKVVIESGVTTIGAYAFIDCINLAEIVIPETVTGIGYAAFGNCNNLTTLNIPGSVVQVGSFAFSNCTSLTDIYYGGNQEVWEEISRYADLPKTTTVHFG